MMMTVKIKFHVHLCFLHWQPQQPILVNKIVPKECMCTAFGWSKHKISCFCQPIHLQSKSVLQCIPICHNPRWRSQQNVHKVNISSTSALLIALQGSHCTSGRQTVTNIELCLTLDRCWHKQSGVTASPNRMRKQLPCFKTAPNIPFSNKIWLCGHKSNHVFLIPDQNWLLMVWLLAKAPTNGLQARIAHQKCTFSPYNQFACLNSSVKASPRRDRVNNTPSLDWCG